MGSSARPAIAAVPVRASVVCRSPRIAPRASMTRDRTRGGRALVDRPQLANGPVGSLSQSRRLSGPYGEARSCAHAARPAGARNLALSGQRARSGGPASHRGVLDVLTNRRGWRRCRWQLNADEGPTAIRRSGAATGLSPLRWVAVEDLVYDLATRGLNWLGCPLARELPARGRSNALGVLARQLFTAGCACLNADEASDQSGWLASPALVGSLWMRAMGGTARTDLLRSDGYRRGFTGAAAMPRHREQSGAGD